MDKSNICTITDSAGIARTKEQVQIGIPLPKGEFKHLSEFELCTDNNEIIHSVKEATAFWWCASTFYWRFIAITTCG